MITLKKEIYKLSEKKKYYPGDKASFSKEEEQNLVDNGLAEFVKRQTKELKKKPKKK